MNVAIVDAFSTGVNLAQQFIDKGAVCYHIRTTRHPYPFTVAFAATFYQDDPLLLAALRGVQLTYIIAGSEMGVALADDLNAQLALPYANTAHTTLQRRNKYEMHRALAARHIASIPQYKSADKEALLNWVIRRGSFPVVVKPLNSAASDGVTVCDDLAGVEQAIDNILGCVNLLGSVNEEVLVQAFVSGTQYFVNTLTWQGNTRITDIWQVVRTRQKNQSFRFVGMTLCQGEVAQQHGITDYIQQVMAALSFRYGPAHNEVLLTTEGPVLIESNARLMGASLCETLFHQALGYTQSSLCADMYLSPQRFLAQYRQHGYRLKKQVYEVSFLFQRTGLLVAMPLKAQLEQLTSFYCFSHLPRFNQPVTVTTTTLGEAGFLYLAHDERAVVEQDFYRVLALQEKDLIYQIR